MSETEELIKKIFEWVEKYTPLKTIWGKWEQSKGENEESYPYEYFKNMLMSKIKQHLENPPTVTREEIEGFCEIAESIVLPESMEDWDTHFKTYLIDFLKSKGVKVVTDE